MLPPAMPIKQDTVQLHLRPPREIINKLQKLAEEFNKDSANQVAVEIIRECMHFWVLAEQAKQNAIQDQLTKLEDAFNATRLQLPLHQASAETGARKPAKNSRKDK